MENRCCRRGFGGPGGFGNQSAWVVNSASSLFNDAIGEISPSGEWRWDGVQWNTYPQPTVPTPVVQTVGDRTYTTVHPDDFPNA